jgi:hypothetical protein
MIFEHQSKYRKILFIIFGSALLIGAGFFLWPETVGQEQVACTMEAKQCPDGSYVSRTGPDCAFAECPAENDLSGELENNWELIKQAIANCEVESVFQAHSLNVSVELKNGEKISAVEPGIDDIIDLALEAEDECGRIIMATE